jgi:hypothetical protein
VQEQVAARHEGVGQAGLLHFDADVVRHRGRAELLDHAQVDDVVVRQAVSPGREAPQVQKDRFAAVHLHGVALAVVKADRLDLVEALERPGEAGGGVLTAGQ